MVFLFFVNSLVIHWEGGCQKKKYSVDMIYSGFLAVFYSVVKIQLLWR